MSASQFRVVGQLVRAVVSSILIVAMVAGPGAARPAWAASQPQTASCGCVSKGAYVSPDPGVAPAVTFTSATDGTSPSGKYEVTTSTAAGGSLAVALSGEPTKQLVQSSLVGMDAHWGFSPDDDRFVMWWIDHNQQFGWELYDLTQASDRGIAGATGLSVSSGSFAFSAHGERLILGQISGSNDMTVTAYDAHTGAQDYTRQTSLEFPPYNPGSGGDPGAATPPRNFRAKVSGSAVDLSWDEPEYGGLGAISGYVITSTPEGPDGAITVGPDIRKLHLDGFVSGVPYVFRLVAVNASGKSAAVTAKAVIGGDLAAPSSPANLAVTLSGTSAKVTWDEPAYAGDGGITGYVVTSSPATAAGPWHLAADARTTTVDGLTPGTGYVFHVAALNLHGTSAPADTEKVTPAVTSLAPTASPTSSPSPSPSPSVTRHTGPAQTEPDQTKPDQTEPVPSAPAPTDPPASGDALDQSLDPSTTGAPAAFRLPASKAPATGLSAAWGFSPDADDRYLLVTYLQAGQPHIAVIDLEAPAPADKVRIDRTVDAPSASWGFSPCGDAFGMILAPASGPLQVVLYSTRTGDKLKETTVTGAAVQLKVVENDGSRGHIVSVDGVDTPLAPVADEPCLDGLAGVTVDRPAVTEGESLTGTVELGKVATGTGTQVSLDSDDPAVLVPASILVPAGSITATFDVHTKHLTAKTSASITATSGSTTRTVSVSVAPVALKSIELDRDHVIGGSGELATLHLELESDALGDDDGGGGSAVDIAFSSEDIGTYSPLVVPAGKHSLDLPIYGIGVEQDTHVAVGVTVGGVKKTVDLTVLTATVGTIYLPVGEQDYITGGDEFDGTVYMNGSFGTGTRTLMFTSSRPDVLEVPSSVTLDDTNWTDFAVKTHEVVDDTPVTVTVSDGRSSNSETITVYKPVQITGFETDDEHQQSFLVHFDRRWNIVTGPEKRPVTFSADPAGVVAFPDAPTEAIGDSHVVPLGFSDDYLDPHGVLRLRAGFRAEPTSVKLTATMGGSTTTNQIDVPATEPGELVPFAGGADVAKDNQPNAIPKSPLESDLCGCGFDNESALDVAKAADGTVYISYANPDDDFGGIAKVTDDGLVKFADASGQIDIDPAGNLYVATGANVTTISPTGETSVVPGSTGLGDVADVAVEKDGGLVLADWDGHRVLRLTAGHAETLLTEGIGRVYVAIGGEGEVYLGDIDNREVSKVDNGAAERIAGTGQSGHETAGGPALESAVDLPHPYVAADGTVFIADVDGLYSIDGEGILQSRLAKVRGGFSGAENMTVDTDGTLYVTDSSLVWAMRDFEGDGPSPTIELGDINTTAKVGKPYDATITASGGGAVYTFALAPGAPSWLHLDELTGELSGTPTQAGSVEVHVIATGFQNRTGERSYEITVSPADPPPVRIAVTGGDGEVTAGDPYRSQLFVSGGTEPYDFTLDPNAPDWLSLSDDGLLTGTPAEAGKFTTGVTVQDVFGHTTNHSFTIRVSASDPDEGTPGGEEPGEPSSDPTGPAGGPRPSGTVTGDTSPGGRLSSGMAGFKPGSDVDVTLHSAPISLGRFTVDRDGAVTFHFTVPRSFTGRHTVIGVGIDPDGRARTVKVGFTVTDAALPDTGASLVLVNLLVACLTLFAGIVLTRMTGRH